MVNDEEKCIHLLNEYLTFFAVLYTCHINPQQNN